MFLTLSSRISEQDSKRRAKSPTRKVRRDDARRALVSRQIRLPRKKACKQGRLGRLIISCLSSGHSDYNIARFGTRSDARIYFRRRRRRAPGVSIMGGVNEALARQYSHSLFAHR